MKCNTSSLWEPLRRTDMTGQPGYRTMEMIGGSSASYLARTPCVPLFCTLFNKGGNKRAFRLPGEGGDHFYCKVEPSPGHIRCRPLRCDRASLSGHISGSLRCPEKQSSTGLLLTYLAVGCPISLGPLKCQNLSQLSISDKISLRIFPFERCHSNTREQRGIKKEWREQSKHRPPNNLWSLL